VLDGVILAVAASIAVLAHQTNRPPVDRLGIDPATGDLYQLNPGEPSGLPPGVIAVRPRGRLFFANARRVCQNITELVAAEDPPPRIVIVDFIATPDLEVTAVAAIHEMSNTLREDGVAVWGAGFTPEEGRMFRNWGPDPNARGFSSVERAIAATIR
jgi:sulfate permease, SulP family